MSVTRNSVRQQSVFIGLGLCAVLAFNTHAAAQTGPASRAAPAAPGVPVAAVGNVTDLLHGVAVSDPYRYMENVKDPLVQAWLKAQGDAARSTLDRIAGRDAYLKRIEALDAEQGDVVRQVVRLAGGEVFYLQRSRGERQFKLMLRRGLLGTGQVLVDPELMAKRTGVPHAINYFSPSWDGQHVAYGMSAGGSEDASLYILNVRSAKRLGQPIARVPESSIGWLPDSQSFTYNQLKKPKPGEPETEYFQDSRVMWLRLGQPQSRAVAVFGPTVTRNLGLGRLDVGILQFQPGSPWMLARTTDTTVPEGFLFVARVADLRNAGRRPVPWRKMSQFDDKITGVALRGDDAYLLTHANAPRNRVLRLNLNQPELARAQEVAVPPPDTVLEGFSLNKNAIVASVRDGTAIGVRRYLPGDTAGVAVPMPYPGAAHVHDDPAQAFDDVLYTLGGWTQPARMWRFDGSRNAAVALSPAPPAADPFDIEVRDVLVKSHDGAMVPMTILHRQGLRQNTSTAGTTSADAATGHPTLLIGYGAYGLSQTAHYSSSERVWLERGGVLAFANVRGSGVRGQDWYRAGHKATKANTWKDGIACAQYLIAQGYATPSTLAVMGASAGGIFAGRAMTEAPALFAAAVLRVGVMDAVRAEESANGITNISEFGSAKTPAEFPALLEMSTYHQIKDGTAYPAVMLVHGLNDPRVDVWHSAKAAARLQAASSSGKPVLLRLDAQAGHGMGSTSTQRQAESADVYSFLLWQMGRAALNP